MNGPRYNGAQPDLVYLDGNFGPDAFRNTQPMKDDDCVRDMVGVTQVENQPCGSVEDWLPTIHKISPEAYQGAFAIV